MRFFPGQLLAAALCAALLGFTACDTPVPAADPAPEEVEAPPIDQVQEVAQDSEAAPEFAFGELPDLDMEVTQEQIDQFIQISKEMEAMQEEVALEMQGISSPEEFQAFQERMTAVIQEKVEAAGMEFETFLMMTQRVMLDQEFREKLEAELDLELE